MGVEHKLDFAKIGLTDNMSIPNAVCLEMVVIIFLPQFNGRIWKVHLRVLCVR